MQAAPKTYHARMQRVLDYIDQHLDGDLDLDTMSRVAAFSKFHFHRQFTAIFEMSVHRYVQLARMKRASHRLFGAGWGSRLRRSGNPPTGIRGSRPSGPWTMRGAS
jgi:AraC family transcriptional regulator